MSIETRVQRQPVSVLVVGDWFIDEYWLTGTHRLTNSSGVERAHLRCLHPPGSTVQAIGGAGRVASIFKQSTFRNEQPFLVTGLGLWSAADTEILAAMVGGDTLAPLNPHIMTRPVPTNTDGSGLVTLADVAAELRNALTPVGTPHPIHIYTHNDSRLELFQRIDWQTPAVDCEIAENEPFPFTTRPEAIVVADYGKGVVTPSLIQWLAFHCPAASWYISIKDWLPRWLDGVTALDVKLLLLTQAAAQLAVTSRAIEGWVTSNGTVTPGALDVLDQVATRLRSGLVVTQHSRWGLIARHGGGKAAEGIVLRDSETISIEGLPQTSYFFAALCSQMMHWSSGADVFACLANAREYSKQFFDHEVGRLTRLADWVPKQPSFDLTAREVTQSDFRRFSWRAERRLWKDALSECGIITQNGSKRLEVWRAMTDVDGYVCCASGKRHTLRAIVSEMSNFRAKRVQRRHQSYVVVAPPGTGKTFLVKRLARALNFRLLSFNITQMLSRADILECFDSVVTTQAQNRDEDILVFIDEINGMLEGEHVYNSFLAPLEDGFYIRGGKAFHIDPCVWLFAGTESPRREIGPDKAADFLSRLTLPPFSFAIDKNDGQAMTDSRVEKVYQCVVILQHVFPDVLRVSDKVLGIFHGLKPDTPARDLEKFIREFRAIQYGEVRACNVPLNRLNDLSDHVPEGLRDGDVRTSEDMIQIIR